MSDNFATWRNVLIKWVNCLGLQDTPIQKISELGDGKFFHSLLNVISHKQKHGISTDVADKAVTEFLKYEYPFYVRESESCEMEDLEIMYVTSLLMLHCILESKNKNIMEHMYKLDDETQVYIKNFFETIMQYGNNITRNVVKHAISECGNNKSLKETRKKHSTESPLISFSTPKCPPIMDVVQSPLAQKLKQLSEQRAVIERLNNELESEQAEKVLLQEELQQERDKTKKLTKQLIDRNDEMKKLREEWLYGDSESSQKAQCSNSCQEALLKKQIKDLETYISSLHGDIDILHKKQDLLQQRVFKAEHQYQMWYAESQQSEALCEKLKHDAVEKEHELAHTKELCSELQRQVQEMKQVHNISVEEDPYIMSPGCRTPENLGQAVIDLRLQEQQEENKIITEQLKKMVIEEEAMKKQIYDLHIRSENVEHEAAALKATNLELRAKVDEMEALQHELEECRMKQGCLSQELDVLSQTFAEQRRSHENDVQKLTSELRNVEASRDKLKQEYSTSETERESMLTVKIELEKKINSLNVEISAVRSCVLLHQEQQENLIVTHNKQIEEKEETICQLLKKVSVLQYEMYSLENEKRDLCTQLHTANSGLSELQMCKEYFSQLCSNMTDENKALELTKISLDRKIEELLHEMNTVIEELEKVKASELLLQESKSCLLEQHSKELHEREEKINRLLKVEHLLNEEKKNMDLMLTQMNELMCERKIVSQLCNDLRDNVSSLRVAVATVQGQNINEEGEVGQKMLVSKTEHVDGMCKESKDDDTECLHIPYDSKKTLPAKPWSLNSVIDVSVYTGKPASIGNESASNSKLMEKSSELQNSQNFCLEAQGIPLEAKLAAMKISVSELQVDHKEGIDTNVSEVVNKLEGLNAELVSVRGETMQILQSNDMLRNELSNAEKMCHDIAQKYKDLTFRIEILNSENGKLLKDVEQLETLKSVMAINERTLAAERSLNDELKAENEAFGDLYRTLKDDFQKLKGDNESLNIAIGTMKNQTSNLHKHNLELNEKVQKYEMSYLKCEEKSRELRRMREERQAEFNRLFNSETFLRQKMSEFQRSLKDISYKFETIVLGTAASCSELKVIDCQRTELEELLTLMCIECEEILHSILTWTYRSFQETEQNVENQYLGISVHLGANEPPETVLNLVRASESDVTKDTGGVNMKTWQQQQELDGIQLQISTLISGIEVALKKCTSVDTQCNHILEIYNTNTELNNIFCDRGVFCNVRGLNLVDRTNLIKHIVTKLQGSEKNDTELEVVEDGWNPEDYLEMDSGTKSAMLTCEEKEHKKKASDHSVILKMRLKLEQKLVQTTREVEFSNAQNKSLQVMLDKEQNLKTEMERNLNELKVLHEALADDKVIVCKLKSAEEEKCKQLQIELEKVSGVKQAYETLLEVNYKLQSENDDMKSKIEEGKKVIRHEYEKKLDKLKAKMKALYEEEVEKKTKKSKEESEHLQAMCRFYKDKIGSYENDVGILKSQVWEIGDKLLLTEREKKKLKEELSKQEMFLQSIGKQDDFLERHEALSNLERGRKIAGSSREVHTLDIIDESITFVRRKKSVPRSLPSGMGAMFDPEDEEGEVFNTTNLADLKAGRCVPEGHKGRISELQYRNSLCPPHLKSSYPAETQFHDPREYRDEDLKLGCAVDVDHCDTLSTSMLLPSEKQRKKDRGQTSYKKPGPPTPGKNGGRLSLQGTEVLTPRAPLKESNDGASVRKASTPNRLKSLFMTKNRRDENTPVTPRGRRLSNIFRRQVKNRP